VADAKDSSLPRATASAHVSLPAMPSDAAAVAKAAAKDAPEM